MATQGLLSVVNGGKVVAKVVAGCNGHNVPKLAAVLRANPVTKPQELRDAAHAADVGCEACLVVLSADGALHCCSDDPSELYRSTFDQPRFNPRWEHGTADCVEVVELPVHDQL